MITVPQAFILDNSVKKILLNGQNCLIDKTVDVPTLDSHWYVAQHALIYVGKGSLVVKTDYALSTVNEGQIVFLPIGVYVVSELIKAGEKFEALAFFFDEKLARLFLGNVDFAEEKKEPQPLILQESESIRSYLEALLKSYTGKTEKNATNWKLLELLNQIVKSARGEEFISRLNRAQNRKKYGIRAFMEKSYAHNLSIEAYAHLTGRSISTFHRDFKQQFVMAPKAWLMTKRLEKAKRELEKQPTLKVSDLAFMIGYENASHFIKAFQQQFGITPKQCQLSRRRKMVV